MNIDYSRNMKKIDAKKLKCTMWDIISGNTESTVSILKIFKPAIIIEVNNGNILIHGHNGICSSKTNWQYS